MEAMFVTKRQVNVIALTMTAVVPVTS